MTEVQAVAKYVRISPRKARLVVDHIRGRTVPEARTVLAFSERAAAREISKVLRSAIANAETNPSLHWDGDELVVSSAFVDEGPTIKRWRARARGRVARINKRTCHITIKVALPEGVDEPVHAHTREAHVVADAGARAGRGRGRAGGRGDGAGGRGAAGRGRRRGADDGRARGERDAGRRAGRGGEGLMGQKVHPGGLRVGVIHDWKSNWMVPNKEFAATLLEDIKIREHILRKLSHAGLSDILIRKDKQRVTVDIYTARPGIVIGKSGVEVDALRKEIHAMTQKNVHININEIKRPELDAKLVAQSIAEQLQNRVSFRRAMKRSLASAIRSGAAGVKVQCSGRLGGSEMSRSEQYSEGRVPLHTIRADIDYGFTEARTPTGRIGVKVWINKGEIMPEGYGGIPGGGKETRLGDQDTARRRGGVTEGLGASRESGRGRQQDREGLGPVRRGRPGQRGGGGGGGGGGGRPGQRRGPRGQEQPRAAQPEATETVAEDQVVATPPAEQVEPTPTPRRSSRPAPPAEPEASTPPRPTRLRRRRVEGSSRC